MHFRFGWPWIDCWYASVITLSTVGYGDYSFDPAGKPVDTLALWFASAWMLIGTVCFGHDGRQGHGDPVQANERRQRAADAGVIEALCSAINFQASGGYTEVGQGALRAFQRILLGFGADQEQRRRRALQAGALPAIMSLLLARLEHSSRSDFRG